MGMFSQGKAEGVDGTLHFIDIKLGKCQRIVEEDAFPCLIEHKSPMHHRAIHLEEASEQLTRMRWHVHNDLCKDENGVLTIKDEVFEASLFVLHDDNTLGRVLMDYRQL